MNKDSDFPEYTIDKDGINSILNYIELLKSTECQLTRKLAKTRILVNLKNLPRQDRIEVIDKIFNILLTCDDVCQQNYLADILLFQYDPDVDKRLKDVIDSSQESINQYVSSYVLGMLQKKTIRY